MAHLYLDRDLSAAHVAVGAEVRLDGEEGRHAVRVSRARLGDDLAVGNGRGLLAHGEVVAAEGDSLRLTVTEVRLEEPPSPRVILAQALAKGGRDELAVQTATELGVDAIIPWAAERSVVRWDGPKRAKGLRRWERIVWEASKQAVRPFVPEVHEMRRASELGATAPEARVLVLEPSAPESLAAWRPDGRDLLLVVGPEGGFAPAERESLRGGGATEVRLGPNVLRTSSAGPAALAVLSGTLGRW